MFSDKRNVQQLIALLKKHKISRFVVSPGSRHIPIVISMEADPFFRLYSVVDERSASFFALGLIQRFAVPVGVICTSGTASANYCSAISEAYYQELPLLVITADRLPSLLDQHEDQMIHQNCMYERVAKKVFNLPVVTDEIEAWHNNRLINEALLELRHHGDGPIQINIPIPEHIDKFDVTTLPDERVIQRITLEDRGSFLQIAQQLLQSKIILICGEGLIFKKQEIELINRFVKKFDCIVLTDKMSNCHVEYSINNTFSVIQALSSADIKELIPDIVISIRANYSFNPEFKNLAKRFGIDSFQNWYVSPSGKIIDPFHNLSKVFEMSEASFLKIMTDSVDISEHEHIYANTWLAISSLIEEPSTPYGHINTVGRFLKCIPEDSVLHLANSNSVRIAQLFSFPKSVMVHCNRGTDGIDGCMSTMVGYASESSKLVFMLIGDLTFFYDMNALWNRHIGKNIRILLSNNGGGAIMHMPTRPQFAADHLPNYISAKHNASARAWAIDRGFRYLSAKSEEELDHVLTEFISKDSEKPILLEVFSEMLPDTDIFKKYYGAIRREKVDRSLRGYASRIKHKVYRILRFE